MARIIDVNSDKKELVRSVLLCMAERPIDKIEQPIDKIVLILGSEEVQFPTKKAMCWDNMSYLKGNHMKLHHEGELYL